MRKLNFILFGLIVVYATEAQAGCWGTVNGRPITPQECEFARQVYGSYPQGHYLRNDRTGEWVNLNRPSERGNWIVDAQRRQQRPRTQARDPSRPYWFRPGDWLRE